MIRRKPRTGQQAHLAGLGHWIVRLALLTLPACTKHAEPSSGEQGNVAAESPHDGVEERAGAVERASASPLIRSRDQLRAYELDLLSRIDKFSRDGVLHDCAADDSLAALAVAQLLQAPPPICTAAEEADLERIDDALREHGHEVVDTLAREPATAAVRQCGERLLARLPTVDQLDTVCRPGRGVTQLGLGASASRSPSPLTEYRNVLHLSRAATLRIVELSRSGRLAEAFELTLRMAALSQALSRGHLSFIQSATGNAIAQGPFDRLRRELELLKPGEGLDRESAKRLAAMVEGLWASEPPLGDVIRGDHMTMALSVYLPADVASHAEVERATGRPVESFAMTDIASDPIMQQLHQQLPDVEDPMLIIWSAAVAVTEDVLAMCEGKSHAACHEASRAYADQIREQAAQPLPLLAMPTASIDAIYDMVRSTVAVATPQLHERGLSLAMMRLWLQTVAAPRCPSATELANGPFADLRSTPYAQSDIEAIRSPHGVRFAAPSSTWSEPEPWRVPCE